MRNFGLPLFSYADHSSAMRCGQLENSSGGTVSKDILKPQQVDDLMKESRLYIDETKTLLQTIKKTTWWADAKELDRLDTIILLNKENIAIKREILDLIGAILRDSNLWDRDKTALENIKNRYEHLEVAKTESVALIRTETKAEVIKVKKSVEKTVMSKQKIERKMDNANRIDILSNLNKDEFLDNTDRDLVHEINLKQALSRASDNGKNLDAVYNRVTGKFPDWNNPEEAVKQFHDSLRVSMELIRTLTGNGNAGLNAFLEGKTEAFIQEVALQKEKNNGNPLKVTVADSEELSPTTHNLIGIAATLGFAIVSGGVVIAWHEKDRVTAEDFIQKDKDEKEWSFLNTLWDAGTWLKEAFLGRRLSLTLGRERVAEYRENIVNHTNGVMKLKHDTSPEDIQDPVLKSAFETALRTAKSVKLNIEKSSNFSLLQKSLVQSYILGNGFENVGSNWSASMGVLMFFGAHLDEISTEALRTELSWFTEVELAISKKTIEQTAVLGTGIRMEKKSENIWTYTIPKFIRFSGDFEPIPVSLDFESTQQDDCNYIFSVDAPKALFFKDTGDGRGYILTMGDIKDTIDTTTPTVAVERIDQKPGKVKNLRETQEMLNEKYIANKLYFIGHNNDSYFQNLVLAIGRQDIDGTRTQLESLQKTKYKTMAKRLLENMDSFISWNSYMYGHTASKAGTVFTQGYIDKRIRTNSVISAEKKLAQKNGITYMTNESEFKVASKQKQTPVQASSLFPEQEMIISCLATPYPWVHRIDTMDGSVQVSSKIVLISDQEYRKQIVEATLKNVVDSRGVWAQLKKLNAYIAENMPNTPEITMDTYVKYLSIGEPTNLGVEGLAVQEGKEAQIFEGRAMISGNVCMNRAYGIVYPLFSLSGSSQKADPVPMVDIAYTTPLNEVNIATKTTDGGLSPLALLSKSTKTQTTVSEKPAIITTPGEGQVGSIMVNGNTIGEVTGVGQITVGNTAFRLAPGQSIEQFLGTAGLAPSTLFVTASEIRTTNDLLQYLSAFVVTIGEWIHLIDVNKPQDSKKTE